MKKLIFALVMIMAMSTSVLAADNEPSVYLNGNQMTFDVNPFIQDGRTLVPMRAIFEAVGATVGWDQDTRTVYAVREKNDDTSLVTLQIDHDKAFVNSEEKTLDVTATIKNDRTFVPLRFVVEALGEKVEWNQERYAVIITTE